MALLAVSAMVVGSGREVAGATEDDQPFQLVHTLIPFCPAFHGAGTNRAALGEGDRGT